MGILKSVDNATPNVGETVVFTITANNNGESDATGVTVSDVLPDGFIFDNVSATSGAYDASTGVWYLGTMIDGQTETLTIVAQVQGSGDYSNVAGISGNETDPNVANNTATSTLVPVAISDLDISISMDTTPPIGGIISVVVTASNFGLSDATGVLSSNPLTSGFTFVSDAASQGTYNSGTEV